MLLQLLVSIQFQVCFTPLIGVLFTFPSRYLFTIGHQGVFRLGKWSPHIQTKFHVFRPTREQIYFLPIRDYHPLWSHFPESSSYYNNTTGLVRFRSSLLTEYISFPLATKIFQFTRLTLISYEFTNK